MCFALTYEASYVILGPETATSTGIAYSPWLLLYFNSPTIDDEASRKKDSSSQREKAERSAARIEHHLHGPLPFDRIYARECGFFNIVGLPNIILHWSQRSGGFPVFCLRCPPTGPRNSSGFASGSQHEGGKSRHRMIFWQQLLLLLMD